MPNLGDAIDALGDLASPVIKELGKELGAAQTQLTSTHSIAASSLINGSLNSLAGNISRLGGAVQRGDSLAIATCSLDMVGALMPLFGLAGPIGMVAGGVLLLAFQLVSGILKALAPVEKPLIDQIKLLMDRARAEEIVDTLNAAIDMLTVARENLLALADSSAKWGEILDIERFTGGNCEQAIFAAQSWLERPEKQALSVWQDVFAAYCLAVGMHVQNLIVATTKVEGVPSQTRQAEAVARSLLGIYRTALDTLFLPAQKHGSLWHIGDNEKLYTRVPAAGNGDWQPLGGECKEVVVSARSGRYWTTKGSGPIRTGTGGPFTDALDHAGRRCPPQSLGDIWIQEDSDQFVTIHGAVGTNLHTCRWREATLYFEHAVMSSHPHFTFTAWRTAVDRDTGAQQEYFLADNVNSPHRLYQRRGRIFATIVGGPSSVIDIGVTDDALWACSSQEVLSISHARATADAGEWTKLSLPDLDGTIRRIFPCKDGTLTVLTDRVIQIFRRRDGDDPAAWEQIHREKEDAAAVRVFKVPVRGWELLCAAKGIVKQEIAELDPGAS